MKNITRHKGKLEFIEKLPNSFYGNPRYLVKIDGWTCRTKPDSSLSYSISNFFNKIVTANIGSYYGIATIENVKLVK